MITCKLVHGYLSETQAVLTQHVKDIVRLKSQLESNAKEIEMLQGT